MSTILLTPYPLPYPTPTVQFLAQAWWTCYSSPPYTWRQRSDVILATEEPLSVILPYIRNRLNLEITPAQGWRRLALTWLGIPCHVGRVTMWLTSQETPGRPLPFSLLTLLPQQDVPDVPFIQLGVRFLLEHKVQVVLNETGTGGGNRLVIP